MVKQALRTYWNAMHPKNLKKINKQGSFLWLMYMILVYPAMIDWINRGDQGHSSMYLLTVPLTPYLWIQYSEMLAPFMISKAIYLCPMQKEERRKYMQTLLFVRMAVPILGSVIFGIIWLIIEDGSVLEMICLIYLYSSLGIASVVKSTLKNAEGKSVDYAFHDKNGIVKQSYINIATIILASITIVLVVVMETYQEVGFFVGFMVGFGLVLLLFFDAIILARQYKDCIENLCDYELYFQLTTP